MFSTETAETLIALAGQIKRTLPLHIAGRTPRDAKGALVDESKSDPEKPNLPVPVYFTAKEQVTVNKTSIAYRAERDNLIQLAKRLWGVNPAAEPAWMTLGLPTEERAILERLGRAIGDPRDYPLGMKGVKQDREHGYLHATSIERETELANAAAAALSVLNKQRDTTEIEVEEEPKTALDLELKVAAKPRGKVTKFVAPEPAPV